MPADSSGIVAVVPVRGLPAGKRRLAALLDLEERNSLVRAMLDDVVAALVAAERVDEVVIASRDAAARDEAARLNVGFLDQTDLRLGYNRAVQFAQETLADSGAILIVPADVPLITPDSVDMMVATAPDGPAVVVAPAHDGGTNGLFLRPPDVIAPQFGPSSARAHQQSAAAAGEMGVPFRESRIDVWAFDLDTPSDLRWLREALPQLPDAIAPNSRRWLSAHAAHMEALS
ncbi:MAG: 2-phospho-L-lactate guanylyltransferase [Chloroflexi bacterium]|nr:2-phospho-L-lactate guanylyltransferase [Chloroflexota bacterium]MYF21455.1 2-phospho-L-lactate guanylyltransferase [Chloroflexota bacterium]